MMNTSTVRMLIMIILLGHLRSLLLRHHRRLLLLVALPLLPLSPLRHPPLLLFRIDLSVLVMILSPRLIFLFVRHSAVPPSNLNIWSVCPSLSFISSVFQSSPFFIFFLHSVSLLFSLFRMVGRSCCRPGKLCDLDRCGWWIMKVRFVASFSSLLFSCEFCLFIPSSSCPLPFLDPFCFCFISSVLLWISFHLLSVFWSLSDISVCFFTCRSLCLSLLCMGTPSLFLRIHLSLFLRPSCFSFLGSGMPLERNPNFKGSLYVKCNVVFPDKLTPEQVTALQSLFGVQPMERRTVPGLSDD